ncbi:MAG TPA: damage-inducible protein DinB [Bacteroidetes bacterium]|nr:damage-inducible protein DinB [Bacteroidota bacterium]
MNKQVVLELYEFDTWATTRMLDVVAALPEELYTKNLGSSFGSMHGTLVHIYAGGRIWLDRWKGEPRPQLVKVEDVPTFQRLKDERARWSKDMAEFLSALTEEQLQTPLSYTDTKGATHSQILWKQMQHLVNHSTFHRGQVATLLRQLGIKPPPTDLIVYYRDKDRHA